MMLGMSTDASRTKGYVAPFYMMAECTFWAKISDDFLGMFGTRDGTNFHGEELEESYL